MRALALIDGEHYPEVVRDAFADAPYDVVAAVMLGGTEKLRGEDDYGVPLHESLEDALERSEPEVVLDLSDEPVLDARRRFRLASRVLAAGIPYVGADFRFDPVAFEPFELPALAVIGSGKRVGKTAVAGYMARLLARTREVVVVAMGRGGPADPVVTEAEPTIEDLLALSRAGTHAASDYLEDAALARVTTVGARRCGGGLAGAPFVSNVHAAARLAASLEPELVLFEGSGAAIPPVAVGRRILVAGGAQDSEIVAGYLGAYRLLLSDLVVLANCEEPLATKEGVERLRAAIAEVKSVPVVATVLRPAPVESVAGKRVAYFSTAPEPVHDRLRRHLEEEHGAEVVLVSGSLSQRPRLRTELDSNPARDADVFLVELKAAAVDVVAEAAAERGKPVVLCDNEVRPLDGEPDLDAHIAGLADAVARERIPA